MAAFFSSNSCEGAQDLHNVDGVDGGGGDSSDKVHSPLSFLRAEMPLIFCLFISFKFVQEFIYLHSFNALLPCDASVVSFNPLNVFPALTSAATKSRTSPMVCEGGRGRGE